ncbi:MAG: glutamate--tRNA ligase [Candidatus Loosdrechtia sp.]|uniref:glutamate--tRNA ligase n=1 Tax=Candidatus Loosdrechtia sp. TaxID=3101272 RepID=UPI003A693189|nr:MAG: glutamate--tRNA ligase [Candidatus Jettenia sp. AMX2]
MVRVRFAPSPTGLLHIGNARIAVFNWLFAKRHKGTFILRIEDTDVTRSEKKYINGIIEDLHWLGLDWQEGPDVQGQYAPYLQSERLPIYHTVCQGFLKEGLAYRCYCTPEELEERRRFAKLAGRPPRYDNRCRNFTDAQRKGFEASGRSYTVRFKVPEEFITFEDLIRGTCQFDMSLIGDFIIMRSDGIPSFHLAVTVDDTLMRISHVIRGEDHLTNTPCHILLFHAMKYKPPQFAHLSLTMGADRTMLSKRHGAYSITEYRKSGYLPEAILNYIMLLGWSPKDKKEKFTLDDVIDTFDIGAMSKAPSLFDQQKLDWLSGQYIREADLGRLTDMAIPCLQTAGFVPTDANKHDRAKIGLIVDVTRNTLPCVSQIVQEAEIFFKDRVISTKHIEYLSTETSQAVLSYFYRELRKTDTLSPETVKDILGAVQKQTTAKGKELYMPIRIALTGREHGPELYSIASILGAGTCKRRIEQLLLYRKQVFNHSTD